MTQNKEDLELDDANILLGNAGAEVRVGLDVRMSENYNSAGASVSVSMRCNQDLRTISMARELATLLAQEALEESAKEARKLLSAINGDS